jgi:hypothetical protein
VSDDLIFVCEICGQKIGPGTRTARVLAQTCVSDGHGGGMQTSEDHEVIFAVFHAECVASTYSARECDVVAYVAEAREVIDAGAV